MSDNEFKTAEPFAIPVGPPAIPVCPPLWNPDAAACWSMLFTPVFGAYLIATNWRALGKPEKAATSMIWLWVAIGCLLLAIVIYGVTDTSTIERLGSMPGTVLLLIWYFIQARPQSLFLKEAHGNNYPKKSWVLPFLAGVSMWVVVLLIGSIAHMIKGVDTKQMAEKVKPLILAEWHKQPEFRDTTIQDITLVHKSGNMYTGLINATINGESDRLILEITHDGKNLIWQVNPTRRK